MVLVRCLQFVSEPRVFIGDTRHVPEDGRRKPVDDPELLRGLTARHLERDLQRRHYARLK